MTFIGQIRIEGALFGNPQPFRMAYLFITDVEDSEGGELQTHDPDAGENAVVIQPGNYQEPARPLLTGPTVEVNTLSYNTIPDAKFPDQQVAPVWSLNELMTQADEFRSLCPFKPLEPGLGSEFVMCSQRVDEHPYISEVERFAAHLSAERMEEIDKVAQSWGGTKIVRQPSLGSV